MTTPHQYPICGKLRARGGVHGALKNPHGPEAAAVIESLVEALELAAKRLDVAAECSKGAQSSHAFLGYQQWANDARSTVASIKS